MNLDFNKDMREYLANSTDTVYLLVSDGSVMSGKIQKVQGNIIIIGDSLYPKQQKAVAIAHIISVARY